MLNKTIIFVILNVFILTSCYHEETVNSQLTIRKSSKSKYEIEIPIHHEGRGNTHQLDPSSYEFNDSDWLYLDSDKSKINFDQIILTYEKNKTDYPWRQSNLRGSIEFKEDSIKISLTLPVYKDQDTIEDGWQDYKHNGTYKLKRTY